MLIFVYISWFCFELAFLSDPPIYKWFLTIPPYHGNRGENIRMKTERLRKQAEEAPNKEIYFEDNSKDMIYKDQLAYFLS